jgi:hemolysin D
MTPRLVTSVGKDDQRPQGDRPAAPRSPAIRPPGARTAMRAQDREFLPAALEMLETPPSPVAVSFVWVICVVFAAALAWSYFGRLDIYAIASGKIQPSGRSKVVQPLEAGKVVAAFVENGSQVAAGDALLDLDPTETAADQEMATRELDSANAEAARRRAAIEAARLERPAAMPIRFSASPSRLVREREEGVLAADLAQLAATLDALKSQIAQQQAAIRRLTESMAQRERVIAVMRERVQMKDVLDKKGVGARLQVIEALEKYESERTALVGEQGQMRETAAALEATEKKLVETVAQFIADQTQKLAEAERKADRLEQELIKAGSKNARTRLRAPIAGIVQQFAVTTVGQVVTSGQALMTIVPLDAPLEIEALILNKDIGFVRVGQQAVVKVEAFPFTRYGTLDGTVTKISPDAIDMRNAPNLSEAAAMVKPQGAPPASSSSGPELAFPATVALSRSMITVGGTNVNLTAGMTVTVEISTGSRRVVDYLLSPLRETVSQTAHER